MVRGRPIFPRRLKQLDKPEELSLLKLLALYPRVIEAAAIAHEPHRIGVLPV